MRKILLITAILFVAFATKADEGMWLVGLHLSGK